MPNSSANLSPPLESLLARLRRRIRAYVWLEGLALLLLVLGAAFWLSLGFDWFFEPPVAFRKALLIGVGSALAYVAFRYILRRAFVPLADHNMAVLLERRFGRFRDSLLTTVELAGQPSHAQAFNEEMLTHTRQQALAASREVELSEVFDSGRLTRSIVAALLLVASIGVFGAAASEAFGVWAQRNLGMSNILWPRKTHLFVEGFDAEGRRKIARGSDLELVVKADAQEGREIPEIVEIRYLSGDRKRENMNREGQAVVGEDDFQTYSYTMRGLLENVDFHVIGGDDRQGPLHVEVVESPTISRMSLHCVYPKYMARAPRDVPNLTGVMQLPFGVLVTIRAEANKEILRAQIDEQVGAEAARRHEVRVAATAGSGSQNFEFPLDRLEAEKTLLFTLYDADGIRSREPVRLVLAPVTDEPPRVNVQLRGIGTAITPAARIPVAGEIEDDYGVAKTWFSYRVGEAEPREHSLTTPPRGQDKLPVADAFEVAELKLEPKQKLHFAVGASDSYDLGQSPNVGVSTRYVLDVVTPEQLRALLEARELVLRRRFVTIVNELTETRDSLARLQTGPVSAADKAPAKKEAAPQKDEAKPAPPAEKADAAKKPAKKAPSVGDEPDDAIPSSAKRAAEESLVDRKVQLARVLQNSQRSSHETLNVAAAFDDIREELINNRVDTEELKTRLKDQISDPLRRVSEQMFPELERRLASLEPLLLDEAGGRQSQAAALKQADAILAEMKQVLDKMLELETFNEVLDILREIITSQEKINDLTKQKQKQEQKRKVLEE